MKTDGSDALYKSLASVFEFVILFFLFLFAENVESCPLKCVIFLKHNELLTGNLLGHMKSWDLRSPDNKPSSTFMLSDGKVSATSITSHPSQRYLVIAGDEEGQ